MTNEEIERLSSELCLLALSGDYAVGPEEKVAARLREIVSRAYEEAAQVADVEKVDWQRCVYDEDEAVDAGKQIAARIRALKDSLAPVAPA